MDELLKTVTYQFDRSIWVAPKTGLVMHRADGSIEACNAEAEAILGWTLEQVRGWSSIDFSTQAIHLDGSPFPGESHPAMETLRTGLPCKDVVLGLYRPDGSLIWLLIDSQPLFRGSTARTRPDAVVVTFADVTLQVQASAAPLVTMQALVTMQESQPMLESLRQNKQFTDHLINTIPGVLHLFDVMAGRTLYVSEQARNLLGYSPEQVLDPGFLAQVMHPDDRAQLPQHFDRLRTAPADVPVSIEYRMQHINGEWRWFASQDRVFARTADGQVQQVLGIAQDISDRKQAEADLRNSEARYRILAEAIPQFVFVTTPDGQNEYVNQQFCRYTGLTEAQLLGSGWLAIVHPDDLENAHRRWLTAVQTGSFYEVEYRFRSAAGQYRWFLGQGIPLKDDRGQVVKWFGTCTDIHEQKQIEVERSHLLAQEQAAREQAEAANRIKDEFLAILSHELRTPLNPILGWAKLLQTRSFEPDKIQTALATIERNAQLQVQLIDDLLDVSRIIRGKLTLNLDPVSLTEVIHSSLETVRLAAEAKSIAIDTDLDSQVGAVLGDAGRLQQIIWNLLSNAIKFTPSGGRVEVKLGVRSWGLGVRDGSEPNPQSLTPNPSALLTISDTGRGISPDFLPHIFEAFRQQDGSTTRTFGGLGLGLAIVRQLVELHGGTITAKSAGEGQGTTFTVELPLMSIAQPIMPPSDCAIADLQGIRVLAVDDEIDSLEILTVLLEQEGAIVTAVDSTAAAIEALQFDRFDLLISDIGMPKADGYVLIAQVRRLPLNAEIPAIALTAYASEGDRTQVLAAGYQQHLAKPIEPDLLVRAIAQLMR